MRRLAPALAICACTLAASCGGGGDKRPASSRSLTVEAGKGLRVVAREYSFDPAKVVVTGGGGSLKVTLVNRGTLAHDLRVVKGGHDLGGTPSFSPGRAKSGSLRLAPGRYEFICTVGDHAQLGMRGRIEIRR
jgi:plastocyanin